MPTHKDLPPPTQFTVDNREAWQGERLQVQKESGKVLPDGEAAKILHCLAGWTAIILAVVLALAGLTPWCVLASCFAAFLFYRAGEKRETDR